MKFTNIPEVIQNNALWCVWKMHTEKGKIPFCPVSGAPSQTNISSTFADFDAAVAAYRTGNYNGLGIGIFNGFAAIDIDHCISDGQLSDMAKDIIDTMDSYTEISPSDTISNTIKRDSTSTTKRGAWRFMCPAQPTNL